MGNRSIYRVLPDGEGWKISSDGLGTLGHYDRKSDATDQARSLAKASGLSQVVVHNKDGKFGTEWTYGDDPFPPRG